MTDVHFSWKQLDGIVNPYKSTTGVVTITPLRYSHEDNTLITDASVSKRVDGNYTFKLPPNSPGTFYQFKLAPNEGSTVIEYRLVPDGTAFEYVDLALVDGEANYVDDPSVPPWIAELEALKESGDFFVTKVEEALDLASNHSAKAEQYAANANASATDAESSANRALEQASYIIDKVKLATDSAEDSKASADRAASSAEDARTSYESSVQIAGVIGESVAEVGAIRDRTAASAAEAKSSATNAGSSASSAKADADRAALSATNSGKSAAAAESSAKSAASEAAKSAASAAKSEQEAVKAVDAASTLNADAKAFGDAVRSGTFKGDTGPANQLDVLETKTVSPNTPASVSITGEAPNQRLSFAIPKGNDGDKGDKGDKGAPGALTNASTYHIVGPGRPDVPSSTAGVIKGNEPVGATYYSEDGAGVGAHVWRRRPGGKWEVADGDTGWRDVGTIENGGTVAIAVRRTPERVEWRFTFTGTLNAGGKFANLGSIPGFGPSARTHDNLVFGSVLAANIGNVIVTEVGRVGVLCHSSGAFFPSINLPNSMSRATVGLVDYPARDPWPSTLPGTPA